MYGVRLILILAVIGGIIAYLGDRIGMRVGRRRLTLFGLRPKHTSVLITILTGILIVAVSLAVLSIASEDVRTALFRMRELQEALQTTRMQYEGVAEELYLRLGELEQTQAQRDAAMRELLAAEERLERITAEYEAAVRELREAEETLAFTLQRVGNLQQIGEELQQRIEELQARIDEMEAEIQVKEAQIRAASLQLDLVRGGELAFRAGDIVLAQVFDGRDSPARLEAQLLELLERADLIAVQRGARIPGEQPPSALQLLGGVFEGTVRVLADSSSRWVVRVVSIFNTTVGEPLLVDLELVEEQLIYRQGDVIASVRIEDGTGGLARDELFRLLQLVYDEAIARGMLTDEDGFVSEGVSLPEFVATLSRIEELGGNALVLAVAAEDTLNTDWPLRIRLVVEPPA
ncbi:MAG: DUF3084 domain-containing protein [Limnochordales bacterium]|nr:MAG: hypothetical protein DIU83_05000 [Bacillota bacterium]